MPAFMAQGGMPYWMDLMTSDLRRATNFYATLMGWEFDEQLARAQGLPVAGLIAQPEDISIPDTWVTMFLADDLDAMCAQVIELGGRVLSAPAEVRLGRMALAVDTAGALFGLVEPNSDEAFVAGGEPGTAVWHELTCTAGFNNAREFYSALFDWDLVSASDTYSTAVVEGSPFAGMWNAEGQFPPAVPSFWQSYLGVADVEKAVASAIELGGEVIREPWEAEFGRMCLLADPMGATVTLCEVGEWVEEPHEGESL